jgi:hypothetical protein
MASSAGSAGSWANRRRLLPDGPPRTVPTLADGRLAVTADPGRGAVHELLLQPGSLTAVVGPSGSGQDHPAGCLQRSDGGGREPLAAGRAAARRWSGRPAAPTTGGGRWPMPPRKLCCSKAACGTTCCWAARGSQRRRDRQLAGGPGAGGAAGTAWGAGRGSCSCRWTASPAARCGGWGWLRAWLLDRPIEVVDEPTSSLDADSAERVRTILRQRARRRAVLVATHDNLLISSCDQVIHLDAGKTNAMELRQKAT